MFHHLRVDIAKKTLDTMQNHIMDIHIGDWVKISLASTVTPIIGTVAYCGQTAFSDGLWLGLVLINECRKFAKNNGTVNGIHYFDNDDGGNEENNQAGNFGIFVRPNKVQLLDIDSLLSYQHIPNSTKFKLLKNKFNFLVNIISDLTSKLEILQVEYDCLITDRESLVDQLHELKLGDQPSSVSLNLVESFKSKEQKYLDTISSLRLDLKNLETKVMSHNLNNKLVLDLQQSESIIDRLTMDNAQLSSTINSLNEKVSINNDLIICYEQTESELNNLITDLQVKLKNSNDELLINRKHLKKANEIISNFNYKNTEHDNTDATLYTELLSSLATSFDNFSNFVSFNYDNLSIKHFKLIFQLKEFSKIIIPYNKEWKLLFLKLEFIEYLLPYDVHNSLSSYQEPIEKLISLIMDYIELNNEALPSLSTNLNIEPLSKFESYFEFPLFNREYEIYNKSLNNEDISELLKIRMDNKGWENNVSKDLVKLPIWNNFETRKEKEQVPNNQEEVQQLKLKIKILESKLIDDKKIQHDYIKFENDLKKLNHLNTRLINDLENSKKNETDLLSQINKLNEKMLKFDISNKDDIIDEFKILEINKLLNTISNQRNTILKLSTNTKPSNDYSILDSEQPQNFNPIIPISINRRIDKLFQLNSNKINDDNVKHQKLLEYINLS